MEGKMLALQSSLERIILELGNGPKENPNLRVSTSFSLEEAEELLAILKNYRTIRADAFVTNDIIALATPDELKMEIARTVADRLVKQLMDNKMISFTSLEIAENQTTYVTGIVNFIKPFANDKTEMILPFDKEV